MSTKERNGNQEVQVASCDDQQRVEYMHPQARADFAKIFRLIGESNRMHIFDILCVERELEVNRICDIMEMTQPGVSHHLALMRRAGVVQVRRDGKNNFYSIAWNPVLRHIDAMLHPKKEAVETSK